MTTTQPTIPELVKEIHSMNTTLLKHDSRIQAMEHRHELIDVGKEAITKYKKEEAEEKQQNIRNGIATYQLKSWHLIAGILGFVSLIVAAYAAARGIHP